jgi:hypothetical protein
MSEMKSLRENQEKTPQRLSRVVIGGSYGMAESHALPTVPLRHSRVCGCRVEKRRSRRTPKVQRLKLKLRGPSFFARKALGQ